MMKALIPISNMFFPFYFIPISNNEDIKKKQKHNEIRQPCQHQLQLKLNKNEYRNNLEDKKN